MTTLVVLHNNPGQLAWLPPVLVTAGVLAIGAIALLGGRHLRTSLAVGLAVLFIAPAAWATQTLGHATQGTFPAGGPTSASAGGFGGGGPGGMRGGFGRRRGGPPGAGAGGAPPRAPSRRARWHRRHQAGTGGGGLGGGDSQSITAALTYIKAHGGGTLAVSSQNGGASTTIINSGADVVAIGGFSGRESQVTAAWLADRVESGQIRYVLTTGGGGMGPAATAASAPPTSWRRSPTRAAPSARSAGSTTCPARPRSCGHERAQPRAGGGIGVSPSGGR